MICDLPNKIVLTFIFNIPIYFLVNLRRTPGAFFTFTVFSFSCLLTGSMLFRMYGALGSTISGTLAPGSVCSSALILYTGFILPVSYMHPWLRWLGYINPVAYAFESLMVNEVSHIPCLVCPIITGPFSLEDENLNAPSTFRVV